MVQEEFNYMEQLVSDFNTKIRDLEERQMILKDRVLLIGKNLIEFKETLDEEMLDMKKKIDTMSNDMEKLTGFLEAASKEFSKFARREDLEILAKQAKIFQPLNFVRRDELKELVKKERTK